MLQSQISIHYHAYAAVPRIVFVAALAGTALAAALRGAAFVTLGADALVADFAVVFLLAIFVVVQAIWFP